MTIESKKDAGKLTLAVTGRLDTSTAPKLEKTLKYSYDGVTELVFDLKELEYISAAGLRVLLKLTKAVGDVTVNNVSSEVYEIFDVTGFTEILKVKKAFREIDLTGKEILGKGGNGTVYRLDAETIVKVYRSDLPMEEIEHERAYAKAAFLSSSMSYLF